MKKCQICKRYKVPSSFNKHNHAKDGLDGRCKICYRLYRKSNYIKTKELRTEYSENLRKKFPWIVLYHSIKYRCNNPNAQRYHRYGGRGIKCLITPDELKKIWIRDKAWKFKRPSLDRINNNGHYEFSNCRVISCVENVKKGRKEFELEKYACKAAVLKAGRKDKKINGQKS